MTIGPAAAAMAVALALAVGCDEETTQGDPAVQEPTAPGATPEPLPGDEQETPTEPAQIADPAAPSASDFEFRLVRGRVRVVRDGQSASLPIGNVRDLVSARPRNPETVTVVTRDHCEGEATVDYSTRVLEARLRNSHGMGLHRERKFPEAAVDFRAAAALDPGYDLAVTNLASALARAGRMDDAVAALAPLLASSPVKAYLKVATDSDLEPLRTRPEIVATRAVVAGNASFANYRFRGRIVYDVVRHIVATVRSEASWGSCAFESRIEFYDTGSGDMVTSSEVVAWDDSDPDVCDADEGHPIRAARRGAVDARVAALGQALRDLGFSSREDAVVGNVEHDEERPIFKVRFPGAHLSLVLGSGTVRAVRGDSVVATITGLPVASAVEWGVFLPAASAAVFGYGRGGMEGCERTDPTYVTVVPVP